MGVWSCAKGMFVACMELKLTRAHRLEAEIQGSQLDLGEMEPIRWLQAA